MKPLIFTTYPTRAAAMLSLVTVTRRRKGICLSCGKSARLSVQETVPYGDQERFYIGTDCCGDEIIER